MPPNIQRSLRQGNAARPPARGFTLLEMLVVLVLTGMISSILMQGLSQVFRLQTHFGKELFNTQQGEMYTDWFRQSINSVMPDYVDGKNRFKGEARELSGLTLAPLDGATDALTPFAWHLKFTPEAGQTQLLYGEGDADAEVLAWPGNSGRFIYYDAAGEAHDTWPPPFGKWPQLPRTIYLDNQNKNEPRVIVAVPKSLESPLPRARDFE